MSDPISSDNALRAARLALNGLAKRQEIIGHNLANVDTPGYRAQTLDFESALQRAMRPAQNIRLETTLDTHLAAPANQIAAFRINQRQGGSLRADGNNVDIDVELTQMTETSLRYESLTRLVNKKFSLLREIATRR